MEQSENSIATISEKETSKSGGVDQSIEETKSDGTSFDEALNLTGTGCFHYIILLCSGLVFLTCGFQNGLNAYILPSCKCDFDLTSAQMGLLNALFLAGGISSCYLHGAITDTLGRRPAIVAALLGDAVCSLLSIFAPSFITLGVLRYLSGFIVGGPAAIIFLYLSEYLPSQMRPRYMQLVGLFWTLSWLILPALAWIIMPATWPRLLPIPLSPWRIYIGVMAIPSLLSAFCIWKMPETPQYLYSHGRVREALEVLTDIYVKNTGKSRFEYPVKSLRDPAVAAGTTPASKSPVMTALRVLRTQFGVLFTSPVLHRNMISIFATLSNMFTFYGLALWLPELLSRFEAHYAFFPDRRVTMCELTRVWPDELAEATRGLNATGGLAAMDSEAACQKAAVNDGVFVQTLIISMVTGVATVVSAFFANKVGRKTFPVWLNSLGGALVVVVYFLDSTVSILIVASVFQASMTIANTAINGLLVEVFPPHVSALGVTTAVLAGRLGAAISNVTLGALIDIQCEVPLILLALLAGVSGLLCCFFPPPFGQSGDDNKGKHSSSAAAA